MGGLTRTARCPGFLRAHRRALESRGRGGSPTVTSLAEGHSWTGLQSGGGQEAGPGCGLLTSDKNAVYCAESAGSNLSIASDGTTTALGAAVDSSYITFDDAYVYWADATNVGSILKAPKTGGPATVLAWDTSPTAIAVDVTSVYWSDLGGTIKSMAK